VSEGWIMFSRNISSASTGRSFGEKIQAEIWFIPGS